MILSALLLSTSLLSAMPPSSDAAPLAWRGFLLDEARHFFGKAVVTNCLDRMAQLKLNVFHWHLTDDQGWRLNLPDFPELARVGATRPSTPIPGDDASSDGRVYGPYSYSPTEVREILAFAAARDIRIVPEFDLPGHTRALLAAHPEFACAPESITPVPWCRYGVCDDVLCAGNDEAIAYVERVLDAMMDLFPSPYFHIGGDECPKKRWQACPKCQARIRALGLKDEEALQGWLMSRLARHVVSRGRRPICWVEVLSATNLPPETIIQCWKDTPDLVAAARRGFDVIASPYEWTYFTLPEGRPNDPYCYRKWVKGLSLSCEKMRAFNPRAGFPAELLPRLLGAECCAWTEFIHDTAELDYKVFHRLPSFAAAVAP